MSTNMIMMGQYSCEFCDCWRRNTGEKKQKNNETSLSSKEVSILLKKINAIYTIPENAWQCIIKCHKIVVCRIY